MSLRLRFVLLTLALVTLVSFAPLAVFLRTLVDFTTDDVQSRAEVASSAASDYVGDRIATGVSALTPEEALLPVPEQWARVIGYDAFINTFLLHRLTRNPAINAIHVIDSSSHILASSDPNSIGTILRHEQSFAEWSKLPWYRRLTDLRDRQDKWEIPGGRSLGTDASPDPVLQFVVIASPIFVRDELKPVLVGLANAVGIALAISLGVSLLATQSALRPLRRIETTIDRIVQGNFQAGEKRGHLSKEFEAVESKLDLLGQRLLGARSGMDDSGIHRGLDVLMERVAVQFDVAQRLSAISRLSSGVAHEIKNPLNAILLRLDLLKVRLGDSDEEIAGELDVLSKEVLRLNRVVSTFLDFSRPVEVHYEDLDLAALAGDITELVRPQATLASISVECSIPREPAAMRGDPDLLKQAILNLVTNAVEAMSANSGGRLRVSVSRQEDNWVLEVSDTGPGIPLELRDKVFQLYFTSKPKGSGIGLAMTYRATQLHNGTISFSSEPGHGTTFRLEFPAVTHV